MHTLDWEKSNNQNRNGQKLQSVVWACDLRVGNELSGRWTWECGEKRSVVDYILVSKEVNVHRMIIEDEGAVELGSDHNLIWCVIGQSKAEKVIQEERYKWKVDGRQEWEEYQHAVQEFLDWEEKLEDLAESSEKERWVEGVWELWKAKVIKAAEKEIGNKKVNEHSKDVGTVCRGMEVQL